VHDIGRRQDRRRAARKEESIMQEKKQWSQPQLVVLGDVKELTMAKNKHFGTSDGFLFNNVPISG
jgi:hypothetical protein